MEQSKVLQYLNQEELSLWNALRDERKARILEVLSHRTTHLSLILDAVDDPRNQSAVIRSCDAMGIQNLSVIRGRGGFSPTHSITRGVNRWMTVQTYRDHETAYEEARKKGYRIYTSVPDKNAVSIEELDVTTPLALVFGNEHDGVSDLSQKFAGGNFYIPMYGFVESFNVSVAAAISIYTVSEKARKQVKDYYLSDSEQLAILRNWISR